MPALSLVACGDSAGPADEDMLDASVVPVTGCEIDVVNGGLRPGRAPAPPIEGVEMFLEDAIGNTRALPSAVVTQHSTLDVPGQGTGIEVISVLDEDGTGRVSADIQGAEEEVAMLGCSDGASAWLHVAHPSAEAELPHGVAWVTASHAQMVGADLMITLDEVWAVLPVLRGLDGVGDVGVAEVAGTEVRLLRGSVDYATALDESSEAEAEALSRTLAVTAEDAEVTVEVGIDGDGVVRLLVVEMVAVDGDAAEELEDGATPAEDDDGRVSGPSLLSDHVSITYRLEVLEAAPPTPTPTAPAGEDTVPLVSVPDLVEVLRGN